MTDTTTFSKASKLTNIVDKPTSITDKFGHYTKLLCLIITTYPVKLSIELLYALCITRHPLVNSKDDAKPKVFSNVRFIGQSTDISKLNGIATYLTLPKLLFRY